MPCKKDAVTGPHKALENDNGPGDWNELNNGFDI